MPVQNVAHVGVCVSDPERSLHFYCDLLGFRPVSKLTVSDAGSKQLLQLDPLELDSYFLERDGVRIELLHFVSPGHDEQPTPRPMNRLGLTHVSLRVAELDELLERLARDGFEILESTRVDNPKYGTSVVFVLDPDGVRVELIQLPGDPTSPLGEPLLREPSTAN